MVFAKFMLMFVHNRSATCTEPQMTFSGTRHITMKTHMTDGLDDPAVTRKLFLKKLILEVKREVGQQMLTESDGEITSGIEVEQRSRGPHPGSCDPHLIVI